MENFKFIAWADTHWDKLGAKCITLADTEQLERQIFERSVEGNFDFTIFAGDRYLKREPDDETKVRADRVMQTYQRKPHFHLIGNHDWVDKSLNWHTAESIKPLENVYVMDESLTWEVRPNVLIHALPADFVFEKDNYKFDDSKFQIFAFHDAVSGSLLQEGLKIRYNGGLDASVIDLPDFDLVIGGDIHIRQEIDFKNTVGGYLGSSIQRTKADAHAPRGWTEFTVTREDSNSPWNISKEFVPIRNFFSKIEFSIEPETRIEDLVVESGSLHDQLVEIKLFGTKENIDRIADDPTWAILKEENSCRGLNILRAYEATQMQTTLSNLEECSSTEETVTRYLDSQYSNIGNLSQEKLITIISELKGGLHA